MNRIDTQPTTLTLRTVAKTLALAGALAFASTAAFAGECPADKKVADGQGQKPGPSMPKDVTDVVRSSTDLSKEPIAIQGRQFRLRQLEMQPGGVVPWHSHNERPAMIYIVSGEVTEYASSCAVPIVHKAGEVAHETHATSHWWQNNGKAAVTLLSFDIMGDPNDHHM